MTPTLIAGLAAVVLPMLCAALLVVIGIQLDFGEPECAPPRLTGGCWAPVSQREEWAADFAAVRELVPEWQVFRTDEYRQLRDRWFEGQPDTKLHQRVPVVPAARRGWKGLAGQFATLVSTTWSDEERAALGQVVEVAT